MSESKTSEASKTRNTPFYLSEIDTCPYLDGLEEQKLLARLQGEVAVPLYDQLIQNGFRRSRDWAYRPRCPTCSACRPVRVAVEDFQAGRSWRRVLSRNAGIGLTRLSAHFQEDHWLLFRSYLDSRHGESEMADMQRDDYRAMVTDSPVETVLMEWKQKSGPAIAACIVDEVVDGYSAVYSFFDPTLARDSLGSFMILDLIERARRTGRRYVYLGYWVDGCRKMDYKARFSPLEAFGRAGWELLC